MELLFIILLAIILDLIWGEPPVAVHPVVLMGKVIAILKPRLLRLDNKWSGIVLTIILISLFVIPTYFILLFVQFNVLVYILIGGLILFTTFAIKGLINSVHQVKVQLNIDIDQARKSVSYLVSRDTTKLSEEELVSASVESLTENITDSVISPLFYTLFFGVLGGMAYRVINTLDAMVGYKDEENIKIGWFPARLDDLVNYIPARITGVVMVISAAFIGLDWKRSYHTMIQDAGKTPSPNSGYPMAAAAGALGVRLEKKGVYILGEKKNPLNTGIMDEALLLSEITIIFFLTISFLIYTFILILIT